MIRGRVLTTSGEPLAGAEVYLISGDHKFGRTVDAGGEFAFENVEAGEYSIHCLRRGYVTAKPAGEIIVQPDKASQPVEIRMAPHSVIMGRVTDGEHEPVPKWQVTAEAIGEDRCSRGATAATNDLGEYRLFGLTRGQYILSASPQHVTHEVIWPGPRRTLPRTWYPGTPHRADARSIDVPEGAELHDLNIPLQPVESYHIRGSVIRPPDAQDDASLYISLDEDPGLSSPMVHGWGGGIIPCGRDGVFEIHSVLPGRYILYADYQGQGIFLRRTAVVDVSGRDVAGVLISFLDGVRIDGSIHAHGAPDGFDITRIRIVAWENRPISRPAPVSATVTADGTFTLIDLQPGPYHIIPEFEHTQTYVQSIAYNGIDRPDNEIEVAAGGGQLDVVFGFDMAEIEGMLLDQSGDPVAGGIVILHEAGEDPWFSRYGGRTDVEGRFRIEGVPPGEHVISAAEDRDGLRSQPASIPITTAAKGRHTVHMKLNSSTKE